VNATDILQEVRTVKSQEEIDVLQESLDIVEAAYDAEIAAAARPGARMVCHGRRLGYNVPLATNDEAVERYGKWQFPENGVFIIKPNVFVDRVNLGRGDSCRITANGAVRMGNGEHAMIIAK